MNGRTDGRNEESGAIHGGHQVPSRPSPSRDTPRGRPRVGRFACQVWFPADSSCLILLALACRSESLARRPRESAW